MKTIGMLGGMSWESSLEYYRLINEEVKARLGGLHSAKVLMYSVDFGEVNRLLQAGEWASLAEHLGERGRALGEAGADFLVIATNTMHQVAGEVAARAGIPLLHIADAAGEAMARAGIRRVGLLGTRFTMELPFYRQRLRDGFGVEAIIPESAERAEIDRVVFEELCRGEVREASRQRYLAIIAGLATRGAEGIALACTEIPLLVRPGDLALPLFDTTELHARAAVERALA